MRTTAAKVVTGVVWLFCISNLVTADTFGECEDVESDTYVLSSESCASYILCDGDDSVLYECDEGEYFDVESSSCDAKENVECPLDNNEDENGDESEDGPESAEVSTSATTTTVATTITMELTTPSAPDAILNIIPIVKDTCPFTDDPKQIIYIISNNSCSDYYVCYHGHPVEMHCTDHLHFNMLTGKCDFPENANCKINIQPPSPTNQCLPHITSFFPHPQKCNYFFYCIKGFQTLQQCPFYYGWDIQRNTCVHMSQVKCYDNTY